eukprot:4580516-Prymnesium_polylepis.1
MDEGACLARAAGARCSHPPGGALHVAPAGWFPARRTRCRAAVPPCPRAPVPHCRSHPVLTPSAHTQK